MADPLILGIDPDSRNTAWALVTENRVVAVGTVPINDDVMPLKSMLRGFRALLEVLSSSFTVAGVVVEGQEIHTGASARPNDIVKLAQVAGGIYGQCLAIFPDAWHSMPVPSKWKGSVPKKIHQGRTYSHYGVQFSPAPDYVYPSGCAVAAKIGGYSKAKKGDWKHIGDAIGLALFGAKL